MRHVIICGIGTISRELIEYLSEQNYIITAVTRNPQAAIRESRTKVTVISWEEIKENPQKYFEDCVAVINLARPNIGTLANPTIKMNDSQISKMKEEFKVGGITTTQTMATLCAQYGTPGKTVFLNASSYNHYNSDIIPQDKPYSDLTPLREDDRPLDYLTEVSRAWEEAAIPASESGIRVVHLGFGMLIDQNSTGFSTIHSLFLLGIGGRIGSGEQYIPMLTMRDTLSSIQHCIEHDEITGYVNIAGFNVKQKELVEELAKQVDERPLLKQAWTYIILKGLLGWNNCLNNITKPEILIKTGLGIFGEELLLKGLTIKADKLAASSFQFQDTSIAEAIRYALEKPKGQLVSTKNIDISNYCQMDELEIALQLQNKAEPSSSTLTKRKLYTGSSSREEALIKPKSHTSVTGHSMFSSKNKQKDIVVNQKPCCSLI
ncbi:MAG: DUF1731 domain-containing protein [Legionella sp.]|nr:DUF1731 domain-containing protein [Legionella sp.]